MRLYLTRCAIALCCLSNSLALAEEAADPFGTKAMLPLRPALRAGGAAGDPCAATMPGGALNLPDVVNLALCNNPQTREVWASSRVQAAQVGVSKAGYLPSLSLGASGERNWTGALTNVNKHNVGLNLSYLLYDFGTRAANLENTRQLLAAAFSTQDSTVQSVFLSAVQSFYQTGAAIAALDAARESERAAKESFAAAQARYQAGSATPADKLSAQTAYSQATLNRITAEGSMKNAKGSLASLLGLDANQNVALADTGSTASPRNASLVRSPQEGAANSTENETLRTFERDVGALIEEARQHRPDLQAAAAQLKAAEAGADAARAASKPSVSLTASANQSSSAGIASQGSSVGVSISVPLFSGYAPTYRIHAAEAQVETQKARLQGLRLKVALDVWTAYQNLITATQSLRTTADLLGSAEQSERVALGRYKAGMGNILDVLNAQSALASARQQRIQSTFNWNVSRATLAQAMGNLDADVLQALPDQKAEQKGLQ
ncbi:MAG: TolC family protein [Gallionellaceae bacterium]|jgi:outer membrane protein TolC|nr:TolC family protein [Gallionellaceae bacterium]